MTRNSTVSPEEVASDKQERDERWKKLQTERAARLVTHDFGANPQFADREAPMKKINIALGEIATAAHISAAPYPRQECLDCSGFTKAMVARCSWIG